MVPEERTLGRVSRQLGPKAMKQMQARMVEIAQQEGVIEGAKVRMDTTVVETDIHYPTDSKLINDGVRVLTREMKPLGGVLGRKVRDCSRSVKLSVLEIARASRSRTGKGKEKLKAAYGKLLETTQRVVRRAKSVAQQTALAIPLSSGKPRRQLRQLKRMIPLVEQVIKPDCCHHYAQGTQDSCRVGSRNLPGRHQGGRRGNVQAQPPPRPIHGDRNYGIRPLDSNVIS